jgi:hypothetical protein
VKSVAEGFILLAVSVGFCTLIARFALTQLFRLAGIARHSNANRTP